MTRAEQHMNHHARIREMERDEKDNARKEAAASYARIKAKATDPREGDLRIWWIPQIPGNAFNVRVRTPQEGRLLLDTLAAYDLFQLAERVKPDYSNAGGLSVFEDGEWVDWYDADGDDVDHEKYDRTALAKGAK